MTQCYRLPNNPSKEKYNDIDQNIQFYQCLKILFKYSDDVSELMLFSMVLNLLVRNSFKQNYFKSSSKNQKVVL